MSNVINPVIIIWEKLCPFKIFFLFFFFPSYLKHQLMFLLKESVKPRWYTAPWDSLWQSCNPRGAQVLSKPKGLEPFSHQSSFRRWWDCHADVWKGFRTCFSHKQHLFISWFRFEESQNSSTLLSTVQCLIYTASYWFIHNSVKILNTSFYKKPQAKWHIYDTRDLYFQK